MVALDQLAVEGNPGFKGSRLGFKGFRLSLRVKIVLLFMCVRVCVCV